MTDDTDKKREATARFNKMMGQVMSELIDRHLQETDPDAWADIQKIRAGTNVPTFKIKRD
jgi:hypothetical protein